MIEEKKENQECEHENCSSCNGDCSNCSHKHQDLKVTMNNKSNIKLVLGVLSGKPVFRI